MALFVEDDFKVLSINPFEKNFIKNKIVQQVFGRVSQSDEPILKYIILLYDSKSPMRLKIPLLSDRKIECAELAELKTGKEEIFDLRHDNIVGYINSYLRYQQSKIWSILAANEEVLWQYQSELLTPITQYKTDKDKLQALEIKSKLMAECDAIIKRIDSYEEKLFGDNTDKKDKILSMTPEMIANV
jgi:hypothetical protein